MRSLEKIASLPIARHLLSNDIEADGATNNRPAGRVERRPEGVFGDPGVCSGVLVKVWFPASSLEWLALGRLIVWLTVLSFEERANLFVRVAFSLSPEKVLELERPLEL